ncbi:hypothetical protein LY625_09725 [Lysobacter sp. GX 14042]|uniref:hypothetical protein n=1 Tax=Lysobacter sp. GX 14042 TaxID=2907155 RepID=UPI001F216932|nr:hypothetical protein [Lysobacter sp. GX 14042]MCE7032886.1 hypothetical protein [Lysobacter sp. GX 14042]
MYKTVIGRCVAAGVALLMAYAAAAQEAPLMPYQEYDKRIRSAEIVAPLKSDLFGEQISLHDGTTEFVVTDVDVPGNSGLPVRLTRRLRIDSKKEGENLGGFGIWDIDVPYMYGIFDGRGKWNAAGNGSTKRCSTMWMPDIRHPFDYNEVWSGIKVHMPGGGDNEVLWIAATEQSVPTDGKTYNWGTRDKLRFSCKSSTSNGYGGEGFVAVDADGTRYTFDIGLERGAGIMEERTGGRFARVAVYLMASRVEDRFGNWVSYSYDGDRLSSITSSDGRTISLSYSTDGKITSATANGRTWTYGYSSAFFGEGLASVTQPDGSKWDYTYSNNLWPVYLKPDFVNDSFCLEPDPPKSPDFTLTAGHPSGARGVFKFSHKRRWRQGVPRNCVIENIDGAIYSKLAIPNYYDVWAIQDKQISGPGTPALKWTYGNGNGVVTNPDGSSVVHSYGNQFGVNSGRLLSTSVRSSSGTVLRSEVNTYVTDAEAASMPFPDGFGMLSASDDPSLKVNRPLRRTVVSQQGQTFNNYVGQYDSLARPTQVTRSSSLGGSRTEATTYHDNRSRWVLGQLANLTVNSAVGTEISYDSLARPTVFKHFGRVVQTRSYHADGTVATVKDGRNNTTTLSSWHRGIPRSIGYADGKSQTAVVDGNGWVTRVTDENGYPTNYTYDVMGRLASIVYPTSDSTAWNKTTQTFARIDASEYGIPAGHWRQTVATGNGRKISYFDALWRPVVVREFDTNNSYSNRFTRYTYDHDGRVTFASYPSTVDNPTTGTRTTYDALGRPTQVIQDSELGKLTTRTEYLSGFRTRVTNPRGKQTTTSFLAFDQPTTDWPVSISHPEGVFTDIGRDVFGKPTAITRRNSNSSIAVTRNYVYDANQQLCKTLEPETGATLVDYDAAGNIAWSASGLNLHTLTCNRSSVAAGSRVNRTYDARNRLTTLTFPDGNGNQSWVYTPDGLPSRVTTYNDDGLTTAVNAYTYNKRRLPTEESISQPGLYTWVFGYGYNANGHLATHSYPGNLTVDYAPNALGQPTKAGTYATGVSYFPNGAMKQFTYGNGIVHTLVQNARGLPDRSRDAYGSLVVHDDGLDYDANGNVMAITDGANAGRGNRDMSYDGLDRLTGTVSPMFGTAVYGYDVLDNLTRVKVAGRDHTYGYDARQRLTNVMDTVGGASVIGLGYDVRGNLANKNGVEFQFDHGNRLREVIGKEYYRYDAHGRRIEATHPASGSIFSMYGQDGVLRYQEDYRRRKAIQYVHLNGSLVAEVSDTASVPAAPTLTVPATSNNGSYAVSWTSTSGAETYRLEESRNGGVWAEVTERTTLSWSTSGRSNGTYRYRVRSCAMGCSGYSAIKTVTVALIPQGKPTLTAPAYVTVGNYTVSWTAVSLASRYELQEQANGGTWTRIHNAAGGSKAVSGKASGTYGYRVRACNDHGCAGWSAAKAVSVELPPAAPPSLTVPAQGLSGAYTVSWSSAAGATSYTLEESANGGSWTSAYNGAATSKAYSGKAAGIYAYRIKACNPAGCSAVSASKSVQVVYPPSAPPALTVPATNSSGSYTVSWTAVSGATKYQLQERLAGGSFATIHDASGASKAISGKATGTYEYRIRACNAAGCGGYSAGKSTAVTRPPTSAPTLTAPTSNTTGSYTVSWAAVSGATRYQLQERPAGGSFATIHDASGTSKGVSGKATGTYEYRIRACNAGGCGSYSAVKSTQVTRPPTATPTVTAPASSTSGSYTVSWTAVGGANNYRLQERKQGGSWSEIHNASGRSKAVSGKAYATWEYRARGCNAGGCGGYSAVKAVVVAPPPPPVPTGLSVTQSSAWMCRITWNFVSGVSRYELAGSGGVIYQGPINSFNWDAQCDSSYKVRACSEHSCSAWSAPAYPVPGGPGGPGKPFGAETPEIAEGGEE